jgi:hypothetical protein
MDDDEIRSLLRRLGRPTEAGDRAVERAAILAAGADFTKVMTWIEANGGRAEARAAAAPRGGLHAGRLGDQSTDTSTPLRFVVPAGALVDPAPAEAPTPDTGTPTPWETT